MNALLQNSASAWRTIPVRCWMVVCLLGVGSGAAADTTIPLNDPAQLGTLYLTVDVGGGATADYLVDTGAGYMTITSATRDRLERDGLASFVHEIEGRMADGRTLRVPVYRLDEINIGGSCVLRDVEAAVLPGASRGLLGLSALRRTSPFQFSMDPPTLTLSNCTRPLLTASSGPAE